MKKIAFMHSLFGREQGICGECEHLEVCSGHQKVYFKCSIYGDSNSSATDWRREWQCCGMKNQKPKTLEPLYRQATQEKKPEEQVPGQMSIMDFI